jgi:hypothetical protein
MVNDLTSANIPVCGSTAYYGGEDAIYSFTPTASGPIGINISSTGSYLGAMLFQGCPLSGGTCVTYTQSSTGTKTLCATVTAGQVYYLMIDSWPSPTCNPYSFTITSCSGTPTGGTAAASPSLSCTTYTTNLNLTGASTSCGLTYQWQSAPAAAGPWTNIAGATSSTANVTVSSTTYYRCILACGSSTAASSAATASLSASPGSCGICGVINSITIPYTTTGQTTCGQGNDVTSTNVSVVCGSTAYYGGEDAVYTFTPSSTGPVGINLTSTGSWTGLMLYQGCPVSGGTCVGNSQSSIGTKSLCATLTAGQAYYLIIDSWPAPTCNPYDLNISTCTGAPTAGTAAATPSISCSNYTTNLNLTGATVNCGITYQWQSAPALAGPWTNIAGATSSTANVMVNATTYYRCILSCNTSTAASSPATASLAVISGGCGICGTINSVTIPYTATGQTTCGQGNDVTSTNVSAICGSASYYGGEDAVYTFTPSMSGSLGIDLTSSGSWTGLMLYQGCPVSGGTCVGSSQTSVGSKSLCVNVTAGQAYYLIIDSWPSPTCNPYDISIYQCTGAPTSGTAVAAPAALCAFNSTVGLSVSGSSGACGFGYQWQSAPTSAGPWTNIVGATTATYAATVLAPTCYQRLTICSASSATATSSPVCVTTGGCIAQMGSGVTNVASLPYSTSGTTCGAGNELTSSNVNTAGCSSSTYLSGEDQVFIFTPSASGYVTISLTSGGSYTGLMLFNNCPISCLGGTGCVASSTSSSGNKTLIVCVTAGVTYYLVLDSFSAPACNAYSNLSISAPSPTPTSNDACIGPIPMTAGGTFTATTSGYTADTPGNIASIFCGSIENNQWYSFTATSSSATFSVSGIGGPSCGAGVQAQIFSAATSTGICPACTSFTNMSTTCYNPGSLTAGSTSASSLVAGQTYYLMIDGNGGAQCNFTIGGWNMGVLPVDLLSFFGEYQGNSTNKLNWKVMLEKDMDHYLIQKSADATNFVNIGMLKANNFIGKSNYDFYDKEATTKVNYYRLKMVNKNGSHKLSKVIAVNNDGETRFEINKVFPNPTRSVIYASVNVPSDGIVEFEIMDVMGRQVYKSEQTVNFGQNLLKADLESFQKGIYYIKIISNGEMRVDKFTLQ